MYRNDEYSYMILPSSWENINSGINTLFLAYHGILTLYLIETPLNAFANRADPDKATLVRSTLFANGNRIRCDPSLEYMTSNFSVLCTNVKVYLYNYS